MKPTVKHKRRSIIVGITAIFVLFCLVYALANRAYGNALEKRPEAAFERCFGFQMPEGAEIITVGVVKDWFCQRPIYAFEILLPGAQYEKMMHGLDRYESEVFKDDPYFSGVIWHDVSAEQRSLYSYFDNDRWRQLDWKDRDPKSIIVDAESGYDVGYDFTKTLHMTHLLVAKEGEDSLRVYLCTD